MLNLDYSIIRRIFVRYLKDYDYFQYLKYALYPDFKHKNDIKLPSYDGSFLTHFLSSETYVILSEVKRNPYNKTFFNDYGVNFSFKNKEVLTNMKLFAFIIFLRYIIKVKEIHRHSGRRGVIHFDNDLKRIIVNYVAESD